MCNCRNVEFAEILYASLNGKQYTYHKNCGEWLSDAQKKKYDEEKIRRWDEDKRREVASIRETVTKISYGKGGASVTRCLNCISVVSGPMAYCPYCKSTKLEYIEAKR